jgi:hypothetical protein
MKKSKTDYEIIGKLYPVLHAYFKDTGEYICSSAQYRTKKGFKASLSGKIHDREIIIDKDEQ